ncbi:unnamed protein product [Rotaria sp. Silwood1]|nr:unnamed protein product [Rotaria sp. Silwood1]
MKFVSIIYLWKFIFFLKLIQCEMNTTMNRFIPTIIIRPYPNLPLTEQDMYDLKNSMRKANEMNDFVDDDDDDDDDEDYSEDDDTGIVEPLTTSMKSTTLEVKYNSVKSSSSFFTLKFINLLLLLLLSLLIQTNI